MLRLLLMIFLLILATQWGNKTTSGRGRREAVEYRGVLRMSSRWTEFCLARFGIGSGVGFFLGQAVHCARCNRRIWRRGPFLQIVDCSSSSSRSRPSSQGGREQRTEVEGRRRFGPFHDALGVKGQVELSRRERCRFCCMEGLDAREKGRGEATVLPEVEAEVQAQNGAVRTVRCSSARSVPCGCVGCSSESYYFFFRLLVSLELRFGGREQRGKGLGKTGLEGSESTTTSEKDRAKCTSKPLWLIPSTVLLFLFLSSSFLSLAGLGWFGARRTSH
ncbi:hypothetical protein CKAH01_12899 [Colletotrichum kahawae]|uniref:Secreted protein n=1 Tax=Colletotrichum kahawae TaxID=34407 RepID=A0AAE0DC43_COLKA|nr:hypothetical protein CKAH01_12899 [Colletotrichum kahawae]